LQIGEPRLDTGYVDPDVDQEKAEAFDPVQPLLPEEVCWILDRALAYEVSRVCLR